jgi:hypothetical protein
VVETDPSRCHDIGVDVVKKIFHIEVFHSQVQPIIELLFDKVKIFGEE